MALWCLELCLYGWRQQHLSLGPRVDHSDARIVGKKKERKYGNVRRRNSSWSEQQKSRKLEAKLSADFWCQRLPGSQAVPLCLCMTLYRYAHYLPNWSLYFTITVCCQALFLVLCSLLKSSTCRYVETFLATFLFLCLLQCEVCWLLSQSES